MTDIQTVESGKRLIRRRLIRPGASAPAYGSITTIVDCLETIVLGDRGAEELRHAFPDLNAHGTWRLMLDVLFPKYASYIYTTY